MTPTARSMRHFRDAGFIVARVEQRLPIPGMHITRDAFGIGDLLVAKEGWGIALIQVTSRAHVLERREKSLASPNLPAWLYAGGRFFVQGWSKRGKRGERKTWAMLQMEIERVMIWNPKTGRRAAKSRKAWRGHKPDRELTRVRHETGVYVSPKSFVDIEGHEFLKGADMSRRHDEVWKRDKFRCVHCNAAVANAGLEVHHRLPKGRGGSDDLDNLELACRECHKGIHNREPKFSGATT